MDRRQALAILGGGFTALAGCAGLGSQESAPEAGDTNQEVGDSASDTDMKEADRPMSSRRFSQFKSYTADEATLAIAGDDVARTKGDEVRLAVFTRQYPRGEVVQSGLSEPIDGFGARQETTAPADDDTQDGELTAETQQVNVDLDGDLSADQGPVHHVAEIRPASSPPDPDPGVGRIIAETDRFRVDSAGPLSRDPHPAAVAETNRAEYGRDPREGEYRITLTDPEEEWQVALRVFKSEYVLGRAAEHGRDYPPYVAQATETGLAARVAEAISWPRPDGDPEPIPFAIDVIQTLPYVPESVAEGADEYIKYPAETLVEGGGDCEDSSLLLASILQAPPFDRDCAVIHPPNHMGVGIASDEYGGTFYSYEGIRYFYVETTHRGWSIGELPEEYTDTEALVFKV